jgi:hypothetical protein
MDTRYYLYNSQDQMRNRLMSSNCSFLMYVQQNLQQNLQQSPSMPIATSILFLVDVWEMFNANISGHANLKRSGTFTDYLSVNSGEGIFSTTLRDIRTKVVEHIQKPQTPQKMQSTLRGHIVVHCASKASKMAFINRDTFSDVACCSGNQVAICQFDPFVNMASEDVFRCKIT